MKSRADAPMHNWPADVRIVVQDEIVMLDFFNAARERQSFGVERAADGFDVRVVVVRRGLHTHGVQTQVMESR